MRRETPTTQQPSQLLSLDKWLQVLAANFRVELTPLQAAAYREGLKDLTQTQIQAICSRALTEIPDFMPTVGKLKGFLRAGQQDAERLMAEQEWARLDVRTSGLGAMYVFGGHKINDRLHDAGQYALRIIGGVRAIESCAPNFLFALRKNFLEAYQRYQETGGLKALPRAEATALLAGAARQLPAGRKGNDVK